jgi:two-component system chemotaxis response regulator CheB
MSRDVFDVEGPTALQAVAIGASAGAVSALLEILPALPAEFHLPIFIVVHLPPEKDSGIADLFQGRCRIRVKEAEDKEPIEPGVVYFAPPDYHLLVERNGCLSLSSDEPENFSRPSIDALFASAADAYGAALLAIILSGASHDGARGLQAVRAAGGLALVQTPESAEADVLPRAALAACPEAHRLALDEIGRLLQQA